VDLSPGVVAIGGATAHSRNIGRAPEFGLGILQARRITAWPEYSGSGGALICANNASRRASLSVVMVCPSARQQSRRLLVQIRTISSDKNKPPLWGERRLRRFVGEGDRGKAYL